MTVCGDGEYIIYTALAWRNKSFGSALSLCGATTPASHVPGMAQSAPCVATIGLEQRDPNHAGLVCCMIQARGVQA